MRHEVAERNVWQRRLTRPAVPSAVPYEEASAWLVAFEDGVKTPFPATLLGVPVEVVGFDSGPRDVPLCVVRAKGKLRTIGVGDLDEESMPDDFRHVLRLYDHWGGAE